MQDFLDPTADTIRLLQEEELKELDSLEDVESEESEELSESPYKTLQAKIRPSFTKEDQSALTQLRAAAEGVVADAFGDVFTVIDELYLLIRIPMTRNGHILRDGDDRIKFQVDEYGAPVEDWDQVTSSDIEHILIKLYRTKMLAADRVNELFLEALMAKYSYKDVWHEAYESSVQGTTGDREARANRSSKEERYFSFSRFFVWSKAQTLNKEVDAFVRLLEKIRGWKSYQS